MCALNCEIGLRFQIDDIGILLVSSLGSICVAKFSLFMGEWKRYRNKKQHLYLAGAS